MDNLPTRRRTRGPTSSHSRAGTPDPVGALHRDLRVVHWLFVCPATGIKNTFPRVPGRPPLHRHLPGRWSFMGARVAVPDGWLLSDQDRGCPVTLGVFAAMAVFHPWGDLRRAASKLRLFFVSYMVIFALSGLGNRLDLQDDPVRSSPSSAEMPPPLGIAGQAYRRGIQRRAAAVIGYRRCHRGLRRRLDPGGLPPGQPQTFRRW